VHLRPSRTKPATLKGTPLAHVLTLHVEEKEDQPATIPTTKPHDWLERGIIAGKGICTVGLYIEKAKLFVQPGRQGDHQGDATIAPPPGAAAVFPKDNNNQPMSQNTERWPSAGQCRRSLHQCKNWLCLVTGMIILQRSICSSISGCRSPPSACNTQREAPLPSLVMEERRAQTALCAGLG
jgi:hypothetical protein